ncbi:hypothetical protein CP533_3685 [Ophiocordyceps camponoti-saundersi (nom. inval.)]|nr:hypothetical protein CP533_3685 [Ophiocordyceps camponoti-saundersi (nom. inval.)]
MPPKKADSAAKPATAKSGPTHASYQDMITDAIVNLKDRNGSSRPQLKKYVKANNQLNVSDNMFDALFNKALKNGVEKGIFAQPKGPSGGTKLAKKKVEPKKPVAKKDGTAKTAAKKAAAPKKAAAATAAPKKTAAAPKKAASTPKKAAASTPKKAAPPKKAATDAPAGAAPQASSSDFYSSASSSNLWRRLRSSRPSQLRQNLVA